VPIGFTTTVDRLAKLRGQSKRFVYAGNYGGSENTIWMKLLVEFPSLRLEDVMYLSQQWKKVNPQISATAHASEQLYYRRRLQHGVGWLESPILGRRRSGIPSSRDPASGPREDGRTGHQGPGRGIAP
jgi:hypothetical protein